MGGGFWFILLGLLLVLVAVDQLDLQLISTFGSVGATATAFLTNYETPIRIIAIAILMVTYFTTVRSLKTECKFVPNP